MAKLVYIGPNHRNLGGHSSKGYTIRRQGKTVLVRFGPVECTGGRGGKLKWLGEPQVQRIRRASNEAAAEYVRKRILEKEAEGYDRLPGMVRIS